MLLLKTDLNFIQMVVSVFAPLVIFPATVPGATRGESNVGANDLTITARILILSWV